MHPARVAAAATLIVCATAAPAGADWVVAAFLGAAATRSATLRIDQPARDTAFEVTEASFAGHSFESPVYYGYRIMWAPQSHARVGLEGELIHLKAYLNTAVPAFIAGRVDGAAVTATVPLDEFVQRFSVSHGLNLLFVNVVVRQPLGTAAAVQQSRLIVVLRAGAGPTIPHAESTIGGRAQEQYEWGRVAGQVAAGIEYRIARHAAVLAEYKLTGTRQRLRVADGTASATFVTHHGVAGVGWRF